MSTATTDNRTMGSNAYAASDPLGRTLAREWWLIALRGLFGVLFGIIALLAPVVTILALVLVFAAYMLVDGVSSIIAAVRAARRRQSWGLLLLQGLASLATAVLAVLWPGITVVVFVIMLAAWSIVSGSLVLATAARVDAGHGRWWFFLGGLASVIFGFLMILAPLLGAVVLTWWLGAYALVFGIFLIIAGFRLRSRQASPPTAAARPAAT
jgi:uncharacterized membrane protein HdeD (DUF308 family)